ncbi:ABC transporter substrate-binding protein [Edaphobacter bradus]|uniref:ABC transporter substrate-binding protein n=1 Tax=Edaphobacter bradus TaxID=2259016 RepID=UPI0021DFE24D|nr:ABC transporter substrate-binding protein [Edaphobacter bradus]
MFRRFATSGVLLCCTLAAGARTRPHYGGTLRVDTLGDPWQGPYGLARRLTMDGLTRLDAVGPVHPALALRWESQNGDHRWQFWIRPNVQFPDGTPLTADAIAGSLTQSCRDGCPWTKVHAVGSSVVFNSDSPEADLPALLAQSKFLISHQNAQGALEGTGPFRITGFPNGVMLFTANDDYWGGRPFVDTVELRPKRSIRDQWLDLSIGRADIVEVPPEMLRQAQQQRLTMLASNPVNLLLLQIANTGKLANPQLRQAIVLAVDRSALYNVIFQKQGEVTASVIPGALSGYAFLFPLGRDLNRAQELRGGATPPPLTLAVEDGNAEMQLAAERIALNLREAGFRIQVTSGGGGKPQADIVLRRVHLEANDPRAALNEMIGASEQHVTATGTDTTALYDAERDFLAGYTVEPLLWLPQAYAVGERVRDLRLAADGTPLIAGAALNDSK